MQGEHVMSAALVAVVALVGVYTLPLADWQEPLWVGVFVVLVVGDSVTTSMIRRYDRLEETGTATRRICGPNPSVVCAFGTRILFFTAALGLSALGVRSQSEVLVNSAVMLPLIVLLLGLVTVLWNVTEIAAAAE